MARYDRFKTVLDELSPSKKRPPGKQKSRMEQAHDDWLADNPNSYETTTTVAARKRIARRHRRRKMRRATQQHMRRKRWGRA